MAFSWTLYPKMWAEIDLRLAAGAETVAEVTAEGGEVSWNLHAHPADGAPAAFVVLAQGSAARTTVRCLPDAPGLYSYLFANDRGPGPLRLRIELRLTGDARLGRSSPEAGPAPTLASAGNGRGPNDPSLGVRIVWKSESDPRRSGRCGRA